MTASRAYENTSISVERSQGDITKLLRERGCKAMQWQWIDAKATPGHAQGPTKIAETILNFMWPHNGDAVSARFNLRVKVPVSKRKRTPKQEADAEDREWRRVHRVLHWYLKSVFEAVDAGLFTAEEALIGWVEDGDGVTVAERLVPNMRSLTSAPMKALAAPKRSRS